jgi:trigger factor
MQTKANVINECKREIEFDISADELKPHFDKAYLAYRNKITVPGFRKGKAPISLIKRTYGDAIEHDALEDIASGFFNAYLKEKDMSILGEGIITDMNYRPGGNLSFKISFETKPQFELKNYRGISVSKPMYEVDDTMVEEEIKYQQAKHAAYVKADKAENENFVVTVESQKLDKNGFPLIGYKQENIKFFLNDENLNKELKSQLMNISPGETRTVTLKKDNDAEPETYTLRAQKVEKIVHPELGEEFFRKVAKQDIQSLNDFKKFIREDLERVYNRVSEQELENNIISELIRTNEVPVPEVLVEKILNSRLEDIRKNNPKRQLPDGFDIEEFKKTNRVDAILQVKWYLMKEHVIEMEKMEVSDEEIEKAAQEYASKYSLPIDKVRSSFRKNERLRHDLLDAKVMELLKHEAVIKEVKQSPETESKIYA